MKRTAFVSLVVLLLALSPGFGTTAAQEVATPTDGPMGVLAEFNVGELPTPHAEVWFVRMQLEPEGLIPEGPQIGPVVVYVEVGQLMLDTDVVLDTGTASSSEHVQATPGDPHRTVLDAGDSAMVPAGTVMSATNTSAEPVTFLLVMMYAAELEGSMGESGEPVGLARSLLSAGGVEFPPIHGQVTIERVEIAPDELTTGMHMAGIELGVVEQGRASVTFTSYESSVMIWPGIVDEYPERQTVPLTGSAQLGAGDGYASASSAMMWLPMGKPVVVLRVVAGPDTMP